MKKRICILIIMILIFSSFVLAIEEDNKEKEDSKFVSFINNNIHYIMPITGYAQTIAIKNRIASESSTNERKITKKATISTQSKSLDDFSIKSTEASDKIVNKNFYQNKEVYPLNINNPIYGLTISGDITLNGDLSLVRIILIDTNQNEHLVYEAYSNLIDANTFSINSICEETCILDGITPNSLRIEINEGSINIKKISFNENETKLVAGIRKIDITNENKNLKKLQDIYKIQKINDNNKKNNKDWIAGETSISQLTYAEKKLLFGSGEITESLPNLQGFEYYKSGVFSLGNTAIKTKKISQKTNNKRFFSSLFNKINGKAIAFTKTPSNKMVLSGKENSTPIINQGITAKRITKFDWRNRHGLNWMTQIKSQHEPEHCSSCWAHAPIAAIEALINLKYNQKLDIDLSEQEIVCKADTNGCDGGYEINALDQIKNYGVTTESCWPYTALTPCTINKCPTYSTNLWKIGDWKYLKGGTMPETIDTETIKRTLIEKGPISVSIPSWHHAVILVGYDEESYDDTIWIIKNSWGEDWGEGGYGYLAIEDINTMTGIWTYPKDPFLNQVSYINCEDKDGDRYCNWGISESKPRNCPKSCNSKKDCDDTNPKIFGLDTVSLTCNTEYASSAISPIPGDILFSDDFEEGYAEDWSLTGDWQVTTKNNNNVLQCGTNTESCRAIIDEEGTSANQAIELKFMFNSRIEITEEVNEEIENYIDAYYFNIIFNKNHVYNWEFEGDSLSFNFNSDLIELKGPDPNTGQTVILETYEMDLKPNQWYNLRIESYENTPGEKEIKIFIDNQLIIENHASSSIFFHTYLDIINTVSPQLAIDDVYIKTNIV